MFLFNMVAVKLVIRKSLSNLILEKMLKKMKKEGRIMNMNRNRKDKNRREEGRVREKEGFLM